MKKKYKIALIGLGSIGKRHLLNIDKVLKEKNIKYSVDLIRRNRETLDPSINQLISFTYTKFEEVPSDYDIIFVTNPTHLHYSTIEKFISKTKHMFIEKPLFDETTYNLSKLKFKSDSTYYVACPLRYTKVIQYVKNQIDLNNINSVRSVCSSYLPDWRPGIDYRETYSAHLNQGGGVSIDLIHEWDYMMYLFGKPEQVLNFRGKYSNLEIESDDLSIYIAKYKNMLAEVHLDYFGVEPIRELQLFTKNDTIVADILKSEIRFLKENKVISFKEERNAYQLKEIENFFAIIEGAAFNENNPATAVATLKIAKGGVL
ncbi:Gfo/Idh/MocA family protein [Marinilactibacillus psychrotolerans]|uniref:Gfo/Idh/MocA family protein n=1 Tax=Marinilactibacillus psychrotolerans TaxID=191770 RepID=UPI0038894721